jgi:hypothetical protein
MQNGTISKRLAERQFNTLAQSETKQSIIVLGNGSDLTDDKGLKNQSKKKMITNALVLSLIDVAKAKGNSEMVKSLWNTYHCRAKIYSSSGKLYGKYCKNRFCTVCCGNRKAELIRKYLPVLKAWNEPQFVTLTVKATSAKRLNLILKGVLRAFREIERKLRKQYDRGNGIKLIGIKSLECNYNPKARTYNPHLHLIVQTQKMAEVLVCEWLKKWTRDYTSPKAQMIIPINDREKTLIEIIKYGTKIFTEPDPNTRSSKNDSAIYTAALYNILMSMKGIRLFDRFGFNLTKDVYPKTNKESVLDYETWDYNPSLNDWENEGNEKLTGYLPSSELIGLLTEINYISD